MDQQWRKISGYPERFEVNAQGVVRTLAHTYFREGPSGQPIAVRRRASKLTPSRGRGGYLTVNLGTEGVCKNTLVHRLVAIAFLGPPPPLHEVNHKNGKRSDNRLENLEWVTRSQNVAHSHRELSRKIPSHTTPVVGINDHGERVEFESMLAAQQQGGFNVSRVCQCVKAPGSKHKGFRWYRKANL